MWEAVADEDGGMWRVRSTNPDEEGRYHWVGHYPGTRWGQHAAERDADRRNAAIGEQEAKASQGDASWSPPLNKEDMIKDWAINSGTWEAVLDLDERTWNVQYSKPDVNGNLLRVEWYSDTPEGKKRAEQGAERRNAEWREAMNKDGRTNPGAGGTAEPCPTQGDESREARNALRSSLAILLAVEALEYHDANWLALDPKRRSEQKQWLLKECLDLAPACADKETP